MKYIIYIHMSLQYHGRPNAPDVGVGNKCFLFFTSYIYAKKHGLKILASGDRNPYQKVNKMIKIENCGDISFKNGNSKQFNEKIKVKRNYYKDGILTYPGNVNVVFEDYFHDSRYLLENIDIIHKITNIEFYRKPSLEKIQYSIGKNDVLCQVRMGDFLSSKNSNVIHPDYFNEIIEENSFDKVYFIVYPFNDKYKEKYLQYFHKYEKEDRLIIVENEDEKIDFYFPHLFNNIIVSNSTFNWWSVFLNSDSSKKIYVPKDIKKLQYNKMWDTCIWKDIIYIEKESLDDEN